MGVMLRRMGIAALLLAAVLVPLFRTRATERPDAIAAYPSVLGGGLSERLYLARLNWSAMAERDSIGYWLAAVRSDTRLPSIVVHGFPTIQPVPRAEELLGLYWRRLRSRDTSIRVAAIVYSDSLYRMEGRGYTGTYSGSWTGTLESRPACVMLIPGRQIRAGELDVYSSVLGEAAGPCLLLAAFGPPGPEVRKWLEANRYGVALSNQWLVPTRPSQFEEHGPPWGTSWGYWARIGGRFERQLGEVAMMLSSDYGLGSTALRCLNGDQPSCARGVLETPPASEELAPDLTSSWRWWSIINPADLAAPRPLAQSFLSDLINDKGQEQFRKFWRSDRPFEAAFRDAFGEELGAWTARWARRTWESSHAAGVPGRRTVILGADIAQSWPLLAVLWTTVALVAAGWAARRRQVTV